MVRHFTLTLLSGIRCLRIVLIDYLRVFCVMVIWISVVNFVVLLIKDLKLHEVQALLDQVHITEVLQV